MDPVEGYLSELYAIHGSGAAVKETSYYGALERLLNEVGKGLKPRVRCIVNIKSQGAGIPDGGLYTPADLPRGGEPVPGSGPTPSRGVMEVKGTGANVDQIADSEQVRKYLGRYGQVLVTNYREFVLVGRGADGGPVKGERYRLAATEAAFWQAGAPPLAAEHGAQLAEYLKRVMLANAPLTAPDALAWFLASYARDALVRVERTTLGQLSAVRQALEDALGLRFVGEKGDHFFRSTLVQTLFYGIFSAWVLWHREQPPGSKAEFDWRTAVWKLRVPVIQALFEEVATPSKLGPLGLMEVLNWTGAALNRVDRAAFFQRFEEGHAVQYFYEPFLEAFDPALRKELGVWYTPPEIIRYMVARVDRVLREELGIADGLADPRVVVLDPCCGTGAYLVEVLRQIHRTLEEKGGDALSGGDVKEAAQGRVFGFEILPAPFVVAHLQLGLLLQTLGAPFAADGQERAGVYLTNALTGWAPPDPEKERIVQLHLTGLPELQQERDAAEQVKRAAPILVVLGNPPYNAFAGTSPQEEAGLVDAYKVGLVKQWGIKKFNLDDLYVRFFRLAERRVTEQTEPGQGIVCYISNFSYLDDPSFVVMRQRFLHEFDSLWFDRMNGDSRETGKLTPEGKPDPSVFSTEYNREGIRVGTAIGLLVRKAAGARDGGSLVRFRQFWGVTKRADLVQSLQAPDFNAQYELAHPSADNRYSFRPAEAGADYMAWPRLVELSAEPPSNGLMEKRGGALIDIDVEALEARMRRYFDPAVSWDALNDLNSGLTEDAAGFSAKTVRSKALTAEAYNPSRVRRYALRPFDTRWSYYSTFSSLWNRSRPTLWTQYIRGNQFLMSRPAAAANPEGVPIFFTKELGDNDFLRGHAYYFPVRLYADTDTSTGQHGLFAQEIPTANLSPAARAYLQGVGVADPDADAGTAGLIWHHALAIGYAPAYLAENADGIRQDWPRIPLPTTEAILRESAALGRQVAALLDTEAGVAGVTEGTGRAAIRLLGPISSAKAGGAALDPAAGDLAVTVGWGHPGRDGVTMPGRGRLVERAYTAEERAALADGAGALGLTAAAALAALGESTFDIYLNEGAYWRNVPARVWDYTIGGYQVMKKWLSYREADLLGRALTRDEVREVTAMARRLAALRLLEPALDANYRAVTGDVYPWRGGTDEG